tara:strand:+ start:360 stop:632 length:273 start_codon:yes stop_codon:yes gene_type:complete
MKSKNDIHDLRKNIDIIDEKIFDLLVKRFSISDRIGKLKLLKRVDIDDPGREKQIIDRIDSKIRGRITRNEIIAILGPIFSVSKKKQKNK